MHLFLDDTIASFYRRPSWSPDGSFLLLPCGQFFDGPPATTQSRPTLHVVSRANMSAPCAHLPSPDKPVIATRFSPILYELRPSAAAPATTNRSALTSVEDVPTAASPSVPTHAEHVGGGAPSVPESRPGWMSSLPYRVLWAVATLESIVVYDSSLPQPLLVASNVHYASLTDLAWLPDGSGLIASSMDGYCTLIRFKPGALGTRLAKESLPAAMRPAQPVATEGAAAPSSTTNVAGDPAVSAAAPAAAPTAPVAAPTTPIAPAATAAPVTPAAPVVPAAYAATKPDNLPAAAAADPPRPTGPAAPPIAVDPAAPTAPTEAAPAGQEAPQKKKRRIAPIPTHAL